MRPTTEPAPARRASPRGRRACRGARNRPAARDGAGSNARPPLPRTRKRARARRAAASTCYHEGRGMLLPFHPPPPPPPPRLLGCCSMAFCRGILVLAFSMGVKYNWVVDAAFFRCLEQIIFSSCVTFVVSCNRESTNDVYLTRCAVPC